MYRNLKIQSARATVAKEMESHPFLFLLFLVFSLYAATHAQDTNSTSFRLSSCLVSANVHNFTLASSQPSAELRYYHLLNFSIQNLRFAKPSIPKPTAIVLPGTKEELRSTILCCKSSLLAIIIRSGGHSFEGLSYVGDGDRPFAVIDLMSLNRVSVDVPSATAWAESGATVGEIYYAVDTQSGGSLAFSAGSCPTIGSGGHIGGGGFGFLSRKHGLAADNVVDAILVDAEGHILDRELMGEEVFWAIRGGGGGSWGAVFAWRLQLVRVPRRVTVFSITHQGTIRHVAKLAHKWQLVSPKLPGEFYLSTVISGSGNGSVSAATFYGFFIGLKHEAISKLERKFPELELSQSKCHEMSWIESVLFFSGLPENSSASDLTDRDSQGKQFFKAKSDYVRTPIGKRDLEAVFKLLAAQPKAYIILDPYGGAMSRIGSSKLPFPHRAGNLYGVQYVIHWTEEEDGERERYVEWLRSFYGYMAPFVSMSPRAAYVNYLDLDLGSWESRKENGSGCRDLVSEARVWGEKYFLGNFDRLVRAKTTIDPYNVFSNAQSIPPLPPKSCETTHHTR